MAQDPAPAPDDRSPVPSDDGAADRTWAGNQPLDQRWWWSPALMVVVGIAVIAYQVGAFRGEGGGFWLNWVMVAAGAAVAVWGLVRLKHAWDAHQAQEGSGTTV